MEKDYGFGYSYGYMGGYCDNSDDDWVQDYSNWGEWDDEDYDSDDEDYDGGKLQYQQRKETDVGDHTTTKESRKRGRDSDLASLSSPFLNRVKPSKRQKRDGKSGLVDYFTTVLSWGSDLTQLTNREKLNMPNLPTELSSSSTSSFQSKKAYYQAMLSLALEESRAAIVSGLQQQGRGTNTQLLVSFVSFLFLC